MNYLLDPNKEILIWGPAPMKSVLAYSACLKGLFTDFPKLFPGYSWSKCLIVVVNDRLVWMHEAQEIVEHGGALFMDRMLPKDIREEARARWILSCQELHLIENKIVSTDLMNISDEELQKLWKSFHECVDTFWAHSSLPELSNYGSAEILMEKLTAYVPEPERVSVIETLAAPEGLSFYQEEEIDLSEATDLNDHRRNYFWLKNSYVNVEELPLSYFEHRKSDFPTSIRVSITDRLEKTLADKQSLREKYSLPQEIMDISEAIADGIVWQDARKKEIWIYLHYEDLILKEIARRSGISKERLLLLTSNEAMEVYTGKANMVDFDWRKNGVAFAIDAEGSVRIDDSNLAQDYWKTYVEKEFDANVGELKGVVASKGKGFVTGRVRIVLDPQEVPNLESDEILVTTMTTPDYVFLMKSAAAIITDTGGLTSHAAIVSRELGVACIVGTKSASRVFKDGDMVEVDAEKGIVRKI